MPRGLGIAKGFDKSRTNGWFISVTQPDKSRPKQYFPDEKARDKAFTAKVREVRTIGAEAATELSTADRQALIEMKRVAAEAGKPLHEVFRRALTQVTISAEGGSTDQTPVGDVISAFLLEQDARLADGKISDKRHGEIRNVVGRFKNAMGRKPLGQCNRTVIKVYLTSLNVGPQSRKNYASNLSFFFNWCVEEEMIPRNPVPAQEGVDRIPSTFSNTQVADVFDCAREHFPALQAMLGVQWLAGLRPGASHHLDWKDIDFDQRRILIQPAGNKLRQPDVVQDLPLSVFGFLTSLRQKDGPITPAGHVKQAQMLHHKLGYSDEKGKTPWPEDVARHTFASNLHSLYERDSKRVGNVLLHSTSAMLMKHYLLKNIPLAASTEYFSRHLPWA